MDSWINDTDDLLDLPPLVPIRNISSINTPSSPSCGEDYIICDKVILLNYILTLGLGAVFHFKRIVLIHDTHGRN